MNAFRRAAVRSAQQTIPRSSRRYASHGAHDAHHDAHHHAEPVKEGFGKGFYLALSAPILFYVVYQFKDGKPGSVPFLHNLIEKYTDVQENYAKKVALHSAAIEQAAFDRRIFQTEEKTGLSSGIELRFPEQLNNGSPFNVQAGQSGADLSKVYAYYEEKAEKADTALRARSPDGKPSNVYEDVRPVRGVPGV